MMTNLSIRLMKITNPLKTFGIHKCPTIGHSFGGGHVTLHRRADANQIAVAMHVVHPPDRRPILVHPKRPRRKTALFARIFPRPVGHQILHRMRRVPQGAVLGGNLARLHRPDLRADGQQCGDETVDLGLGLAFRRFHHQGARNRPRHRRRMEPVVDQPFCDVIHRNAGLGKGPRVQNTFMRHPALVAHEQHRIGPLQPRRDIVGVQNGHPRRLRQPLAAHHQAIGPTDQQDRGRPIRRR